MAEEIKLEGIVFWQILVALILTPVTLIHVVLKKKSFKDIFAPVILFWSFLKEAKATFLLILLLICCYIGQLFLSPTNVDGLVLYPSNIFSLKFYTLFTAGFLHANVAHLFGNILILFGLGRLVEKEFGSWGLLGIYFSSLLFAGLIGSLIYLALGDLTPGLGASGAIAGVIAAAMLSRPFTFTFIYIIPLPVAFIGLISLYADVSGFFLADGVGHAVHLGGFLAISLGLFLFKRDKHFLRGLLINMALGIILLIASLTGFI